MRLVQERIYAIFLNTLRLSQLRKLKGVAESHRWTLWSYKPSPYAGRITLFRPADFEYSRKPAVGWESLAEGGVEVHLLPGKHGDLVKEPGVQELTKRLNLCLSAVRFNKK